MGFQAIYKCREWLRSFDTKCNYYSTMRCSAALVPPIRNEQKREEDSRSPYNSRETNLFEAGRIGYLHHCSTSHSDHTWLARKCLGVLQVDTQTDRPRRIWRTWWRCLWGHLPIYSWIRILWSSTPARFLIYLLVNDRLRLLTKTL